MLNTSNLIIDHFVDNLLETYQNNYGETDPPYGRIIAWLGHLALENIANSNILYHNVEHTIMVTLVAQQILRGKHLCEGGVRPTDWFHFIAAVLCHDIGYISGICRQDEDDWFATGVDDQLIQLPITGTDAVLAPYHVDRSKLFVRERFANSFATEIDTERIASYIEMTRFPSPKDDEFYDDTTNYRGLVRAADFIGQLGDPNYLRKIPALYYEFEEIGVNAELGYHTPDDMRKGYARFYWNVIQPHIKDALRYLRVTQEGKQWIANLHSHVFEIEHGQLFK